ncbi:1-acyl-sn-glycerol-3-phosphate acyltransferase [Brucepastera parasyntrophica]|uniref:lysophospholipid acyltransferase family protein n=1 Tax=Brucepastera parasyntrophica TaxID=2880008 RepID=UPI00210EFD53|nr:lysophospholipid acyltransferase family protein [Brucepastera parasyntrophica]ULQ59849.1 1-acyl-sn-glycerol-3-phosphate acyltransferase [Brucepastera parasyntrophica]
MTLITLLCLFVSMGWIALVNRFAYGISTKLSQKVNRIITTTYASRIFSIFSAYMNFHFAGEKDHVDELPEQYLIMSNHQSLLDIPLFMRFLDGPRLRFVAKAELGRNVPLVSVMLKSDRHGLIDRTGSPSKTMKAMDLFAERVKENNWIPVIFPEGTRSQDGSLGTFHAAGFRRFLTVAPMPVAVCALDGGWRISTLKGFAKNLHGGFYRVKIVKIYPAPTNKAEQIHILEEGKALIQKQLDAWRKQESGTQKEALP